MCSKLPILPAYVDELLSIQTYGSLRTGGHQERLGQLSMGWSVKKLSNIRQQLSQGAPELMTGLMRSQLLADAICCHHDHLGQWRCALCQKYKPPVSARAVNWPALLPSNSLLGLCGCMMYRAGLLGSIHMSQAHRQISISTSDLST